MLRKKITNKEKFQFREEEVLSPLPTKGRNSFQSRLVRKADDKLTYKQSGIGVFGSQGTFGGGIANQGFSHHGVVKQEDFRQVGGLRHVQEAPLPALARHQMGSSDPVLDEIVAKLKSGLQLGSNTQMEATTTSDLMAVSQRPVIHNIPPPRFSIKQEAVSTRMLQKTCPPAESCICFRPLKLVMCEVCGETFCARVALVCSIHSRALYLQDVKECRGCKQTNKQALKEYDLPPGMEKGIKNVVDRKSRGVGMN